MIGLHLFLALAGDGEATRALLAALAPLAGKGVAEIFEYLRDGRLALLLALINCLVVPAAVLLIGWLARRGATKARALRCVDARPGQLAAAGDDGNVMVWEF